MKDSVLEKGACASTGMQKSQWNIVNVCLHVVYSGRFDDYSEVAPRPNVTPHPVISHNLEYSPGSYVNSAQLSNNNFTMIRFIFCWTGVATESSALTCE